MTYILDTNVLVHTLRNSDTFQRIETQLDPYGANHETLISTVSIGELYSLAKRNRWGTNLLEKVKLLLETIAPIPVDGDDLMEAYSDIDAFSQGKHPVLALGRSAVNMGKNDLWIAATATVFQATLLTTDKDFNHLHNVFFNVEYIHPKST
jgi:tRNA(fMet)-specific endonuclease VapC